MPKSEIAQTLGDWLIQLREEAGYGTMQEAADALGVSRTQLYRWERNESVPGRASLSNIADAYRVSVNEVGRRAGYPIDTHSGASEWAETLARRIERRTAHLSESRRRAVERAVDSLLTATAA